MGLARSFQGGLKYGAARFSDCLLYTSLVEHVDEVLGLCEPLSHVIQAAAGFEPLVESLLGGDVATLLVEDAGAVELIAGQLAAAGAAGEASFLSLIHI